MVQQVNGFKLDKTHTFAVNMFDDVSRYMQVPDEYEPPEDKEFETPVSACSNLLPRRALCMRHLLERQPCECPERKQTVAQRSSASAALDARPARDTDGGRLGVPLSVCVLQMLGCWRREADADAALPAGESVAVDDGSARPGPVCDPVPGRDGDLLERRAADAGGGSLQALLLDRILRGLVPPTAPT